MNNLISQIEIEEDSDIVEALNLCTSISYDIENLFDVLTDICTKINGHPRQEFLNAALKRAIYRTDELKSLKVKLFDEFCFINKLFCEEPL